MHLLRRLLSIVLGAVLLLTLVSVLPGPLSGTALGGSPPFEPPGSWASTCASRRPAGSPLVRGTNCRWLSLDGVWRRYLVYVPRRERFPLHRSWPVVMVFHGNRSSGEQIRSGSGWLDTADETGVVVVFPTAWRYQRTSGEVGTRWNTWKLPDEIEGGVRLDGYPADSPYPARDTEFVRRMLEDVRGQLDVADRRVFGAGFSNGGKFVIRAAVDLPHEFAAITCGGFCDAPPPSVVVGRRVPVLYALGTRDPVVLDVLAEVVDPDPRTIPLTWRAARPIVWSLLAEHVAAWRIDPDVDDVVAGAASTRVTWHGSLGARRDDMVLRFVLLAGVSHQYPMPGNNRHHFDLAALSWRFFQSHPMR